VLRQILAKQLAAGAELLEADASSDAASHARQAAAALSAEFRVSEPVEEAKDGAGQAA